MGLFGKSKKEAKSEIPSLPELPKLPDFPVIEEELDQPYNPPSFSNNPLLKKFPENTIKSAISGGEEVYDETKESLNKDEMGIMEEPLKNSLKDIGMKRSEFVFEASSLKKEKEPVFVRLDKFEEALNVFNETKSNLSEIEKLLLEVRRIREKEDLELQKWEMEIKNMKNKIEKIDREVFSKL
ncbi:MAG: hypothetical protein QXX55_01740 [Candidatus Pacearchaeota archaeon]